MKIKTILVLCCLSFALLLSGCGGAHANETIYKMTAESGTPDPQEALKTKALQSYREILKAAPALQGDHMELNDASFDYEQNHKLFGDHFDLFAVYDLNGDELPELITLTAVNFRWSKMNIYTFSGEAPMLIKASVNTLPDCTIEQISTAGGAYNTYICEANHLHSVWRGQTPVGEMEENSAYALDMASLIEVECTAGENDKTVYFNDIAKVNTVENLDMITY